MMDKTIYEFGYDRDFGGWFPKGADIQFKAILHDVQQPNGTVSKQWLLEHNLDYYDLVFVDENGLGIDPKEITGEMVIKACLCASWDDASFFFATSFPQLVRGGEQAEGFDEDDDEDDEDWHSDTCTCETCIQNYPERSYLLDDNEDEE